ncbi:MBL fold metallo-hydrolase [Nocardioides sp. Soil797]|nr:MBL fold metallo-hydrolase [Nocardioides sp. Soil797]
MRITKFGHACVRIEDAGQAMVFDPGMFTDPEAVDGATAVLITHEHADHFDPERLRATEAPIFTIDAVARKIAEEAPDLAERVTVVAPGEEFLAGLPARAVGELHAVIHPEYPRFHNSGFVVGAGGKRIYHPGDALTLPGEDVDVLLVPSSAPWLKVSEAIDFTRDVGAPVNLAIHDRIYTEAAHAMLEGHMGRLLPESQTYVRRADGEDL